MAGIPSFRDWGVSQEHLLTEGAVEKILTQHLEKSWPHGPEKIAQLVKKVSKEIMDAVPVPRYRKVVANWFTKRAKGEFWDIDFWDRVHSAWTDFHVFRPKMKAIHRDPRYKKLRGIDPNQIPSLKDLEKIVDEGTQAYYLIQTKRHLKKLQKKTNPIARAQVGKLKPGWEEWSRDKLENWVKEAESLSVGERVEGDIYEGVPPYAKHGQFIAYKLTNDADARRTIKQTYCIGYGHFGSYGGPPYYLIMRKVGSELQHFGMIIPGGVSKQPEQAFRSQRNKSGMTGMLSADEIKSIVPLLSLPSKYGPPIYTREDLLPDLGFISGGSSTSYHNLGPAVARLISAYDVSKEELEQLAGRKIEIPDLPGVPKDGVNQIAAIMFVSGSLPDNLDNFFDETLRTLQRGSSKVSDLMAIIGATHHSFPDKVPGMIKKSLIGGLGDHYTPSKDPEVTPNVKAFVDYIKTLGYEIDMNTVLAIQTSAMSMKPVRPVLSYVLKVWPQPEAIVSGMIQGAIRASNFGVFTVLIPYIKNASHLSGDPFAEVVKQGGVKPIRQLMERGADPNKPDLKGSLPLFWALSHTEESMRWKVIRTLIKGGANPNLKDSSGRSPLEWAELMKDEDPALRAVMLGGS